MNFIFSYIHKTMGTKIKNAKIAAITLKSKCDKAVRLAFAVALNDAKSAVATVPIFCPIIRKALD